jgi:hypothetical protein
MKGSASRGDRHSMSRLQSRYGNTIQIMNGRITSKLQQQQQRLLRVYHGKAKDHAALTDLLGTILGQHGDCLERLTLRKGGNVSRDGCIIGHWMIDYMMRPITYLCCRGFDPNKPWLYLWLDRNLMDQMICLHTCTEGLLA